MDSLIEDIKKLLLSKLDVNNSIDINKLAWEIVDLLLKHKSDVRILPKD